MSFLDPDIVARSGSDDPEIRRVALLEAADDASLYHDLFLVACDDVEAAVRMEAAKALEGVATAEGIKALVQLLGDSDGDVREAAQTSLREICDPTAAPALLEQIEAVAGPAKAAILRGLRECRDPAAIGPALRALQDKDATVRREAISVLGYLQSSRRSGLSSGV